MSDESRKRVDIRTSVGAGFDVDDGWDTVGPSKAWRGGSKKNVVVEEVVEKKYSAFDPSTWNTATKVVSAAAPKVTAAKQKPIRQSMGKPVAPLPPEREALEPDEKKQKMKKTKDTPRVELAASCERLLLHSSADGTLSVPELSEALARARGFPSWKVKYKHMYGSFHDFLQKCPTLAVVRVGGEERVIMADAIEDVPFTPTSETHTSKVGSRKRSGGMLRFLSAAVRVFLACACLLSGLCTLKLLGPQARPPDLPPLHRPCGGR